MTVAEKAALAHDVVAAAIECHLTQKGARILLSMLETPEEAQRLLETLAELRKARQ